MASLAAGLATGAGAIPVLFFSRISDRLLDVMLGFAVGVMLAASSFSLIVPAIELGGIWVSVVGLAIGALTLHLIDRLRARAWNLSFLKIDEAFARTKI